MPFACGHMARSINAGIGMRIGGQVQVAVVHVVNCSIGVQENVYIECTQTVPVVPGYVYL